ncbi:MAG: hypothetical protein HYW91_02285 [Candidatus Sungbacteria bacterium]|nr:hypothetical protein [Candidatus Sungbacteria bacterium]
MSREQIKFRPNIPEEMREVDRGILERAEERIKEEGIKGSIDHDLEFFRIRVPLKTGEEVTQYIPRNSGDIPIDKTGKEKNAAVEEAVEAVQRFFPELEKPSLKEAVMRLRASKSKK